MTHCKHCGDEVKAGITCDVCKKSLYKLQQCWACHMELAHDKFVPDRVDVRDPKTSVVSDEPPIPRPVNNVFEGEAGAVHEGKSGQSLADGWAMLNGYESGLTQYKDKKYEHDE